MIRGIIFDLDNTLVDFMKMKELCIWAAVDAMIDAGLPMERKAAKDRLYEIYEKEGIEYQQVFDRFLEEELGEIDYKIQAAGIHAYRRERSAALVPYSNVHSTIIALIKAGLKLGVVSDAPRQQVWLRLVQLNLHHMFDCVVAFEDTGQKKPAQEPFFACLKEMKCRPEECIMVGDWAERDVMGAKSIGMTTVFARYGDIFDTGNSEADYEINDIKELIVIINKLNAKKTKV